MTVAVSHAGYSRNDTGMSQTSAPFPRIAF
jgi:hypothetical protein